MLYLYCYEINLLTVRYVREDENIEHLGYIIENDFYNWLTYDIDIRGRLGLLIKMYDEMDIYDENVYFKFWEFFLNNL